MPSLTDDLMTKAAGKAADKGPQAIANMLDGAKKGVKTGGKVLKGICLMLGKGVDFTTESVMSAINEKVLLKKTGDIKFSSRNVSIDELSKSGFVKRIDDAVTADVMRHFDKACKDAGVKYSAMKDEREPQNPQYYIFYEGKTADVILHVMQEAYKDYMAEQEQKAKGLDKSNTREGIRAKLAFFRDRVAARDRESEAVEKHRTHTEPQR